MIQNEIMQRRRQRTGNIETLEVFMSIFLSIIGIFIIIAVLWDGFETMVLLRRITQRFRFARFFYRSTWRLWTLLLKVIPSNQGRATYRALFGPPSLLLLLST